MFQQLPMYQQVGNRAFRKDLSNITKLSAHLGNPQRNFKCIHVAGTNGKGSVSHMLASVLQENHYKVGLYTSPHLRDFRERIKINGLEIPEKAVVAFIRRNRMFLEQSNYSFFEMTVGMAFDYFAQEQVDIAVIEVGLGGRLDSTNIIDPELSVITNIGLDHMNFLGNTYSAIAREKAGIIKPGKPVVIGETTPETLPVFKQVASDTRSEIFLAEDFSGILPKSDLKGHYQQKNIRTVLRSFQVLQDHGWEISSGTIEKGLSSVIENTGLRGRWEILGERPKIICDTAHNEDGLRLVLQQLLAESFDQLHIVLGMVSDKDLNAILPLFPRVAKYYFCRPAVPRGMSVELLQEEGRRNGLIGASYSSVAEALEQARIGAGAHDVIYVGGSTFTVAEII